MMTRSTWVVWSNPHPSDFTATRLEAGRRVRFGPTPPMVHRRGHESAQLIKQVIETQISTAWFESSRAISVWLPWDRLTFYAIKWRRISSIHHHCNTCCIREIFFLCTCHTHTHTHTHTCVTEAHFSSDFLPKEVSLFLDIIAVSFTS